MGTATCHSFVSDDQAVGLLCYCWSYASRFQVEKKCHIFWQKRRCSSICIWQLISRPSWHEQFVCRTCMQISRKQSKVDLVFVANVSGIRQKIKVCWPWSCCNFVRVDIVDINNFRKIPSFCGWDTLLMYFFPGSRSNSLRTFSMSVACSSCQGQLINSHCF